MHIFWPPLHCSWVSLQIRVPAYSQEVDEDITQYFKSTSGYNLEEVVADLSEYGLKLNFDEGNQRIAITGTPTKTTEAERTIPISASNRFGETDSNFKLDILSPPIRLKDIGDKAGQVGKYIDPIPLRNYFEIPTGSPAIDGWDIEAKSQGLYYKDSYLIKNYGINQTISELRTIFSDKKIYLSLDIDALDPSYAPGTSTPEPFGLSSFDVLKIIENFSSDLVGFDLVEVCPLYDKGETAIIAAKYIRSVIENVWLNQFS